MIVMVPARVNYRNNEAGLIATEILPIDEAEKALTTAVHIRINTIGIDDIVLRQLAESLGERPGKCDVYLHCQTPEHGEITVHATSACRVAPSPDLRAMVEQILGEDTMWYTGGNGLPQHD
jgi:hypothetical protein